MPVATAKIHFEKQVLVLGTKQSSQAKKAVRLTRQSGWQGSEADKAVRLTRQWGWQGSEADKAVRLARLSDLPALFCACLLLVLTLPLALVILTNTPWAIYFSYISMVLGTAVVDYIIILKYQACLEMLAWIKRASLFCLIVNWAFKSFVTLDL
jgi:hypothetical protein